MVRGESGPTRLPDGVPATAAPYGRRMIAVELALTPTPERLAARPEHRALLARLYDEGAVLAAGPWADDSGALLVFTGDRAEVDAILESDPYYRAPGVEIVAIREWQPAVGP